MGRKEPDMEKPFMTNRELLSDMYSKVNRIHNVVMGDKEAEVNGLIHDVKELKESDKKRTTMYMIVAALASGIGLTFKTAWDYMIHK